MKELIDIRLFKNEFKKIEIKIGGLRRLCPLYSAGADLWIVGNEHLSFGSDIEFTKKIGKLLAEKLKKFESDCILTVETKSLGIAYEIAKRLGHKTFALARKDIRPYTSHFISSEIKSITSQKSESIYLDNSNIERVKNKKIILFDDVISTCNTMVGLIKLAEKSGAKISCVATIWLEGPWPFEKFDKELQTGCLIYLGVLPIFAGGNTYKKLYLKKVSIERRFAS